MGKTEKSTPISFVKMNLNLCYLFDQQEFCFLAHLLHLDFIRKCNYNTSFSRDFMLKKFRMNRRIFQRCTNRFTDLGLLEKKRQGVHIDYLMNQKLYQRLVEILCATQDIFAVSEFCEREFIKAGRKIESITDSEIQILREQGEANKQRWM